MSIQPVNRTGLPLLFENARRLFDNGPSPASTNSTSGNSLRTLAAASMNVLKPFFSTNLPAAPMVSF